MSIGYLPQEGLTLSGRTVFEECLTVFDELREMEKEVERLAGQLAVLDHAGPEYEAAAERYSLLQERFHALDGYALDAQGRRCAHRPGLRQRRLGAPAPRSFPAVGRCASPWPSCCWPSPTCCFSMSPPTTLTLKPATGSKAISRVIPSATSLSLTTATFSMLPLTAR